MGTVFCLLSSLNICELGFLAANPNLCYLQKLHPPSFRWASTLPRPLQFGGSITSVSIIVPGSITGSPIINPGLPSKVANEHFNVGDTLTSMFIMALANVESFRPS